MAAYAALRSLSHILHQILHPPPLNNIIIDRELIGSLQDKVSFLIDFFETFSSQRCKEIEDLEKRITDAAYEAEDIIESHVVSQIQSQYALHPQKKSRRQKIQERVEKFFRIQQVLKKKDAYQGIPKVIKKFISIQKKLVMIKNKGGMEDVRREKSAGASSSRSLPRSKNIMVGFDEHLDHIKSALATDESKLQIVPIVGMGGIGKTTLATNVYNDSFVAEHFDLRAWVTVTQEYTELEIVRELLPQINSNIDRKEHEQSADVLGNQLYQELFGRRYLIILDDMWDIKVWDGIKRFLPPDGDGSRVLVTTRLLKLAEDVGSCRPYQIGLLDKDKSWDLILEKVFAKEKCPIELEEIGRSIAKKCRGLPLALVVIGGLLAKSQKTEKFWKYVEEDVTSAANDEDNSHCIKILSSSYSHLPVHLKPCFLYLAMFPKNFEMSVSRLIRLLVAEGFIKPANEKSLEEAAEEYLEDLSDRNLVMVGKRGHSGKVKTYNIHDLLRDLCCREAQKDNFLRIVKLDNPNASPHMERERRLSIHIGTENEKICEVLRSATLSRSFLSYSYWESRRCVARRLNLLRILDVADYYSMDEILQLINSRYITCAISLDMRLDWSFLPLFWNLQTLVVPGSVSLPSEIWQMPQLRHLKMPRITLPDPLDAQVDSHNIMVLENLQTLTTLKDFIFREQVLKRIPNLKKLGVHCHMAEEIRSFHLSNLVFLDKLESLFLSLKGTWENIAFPVSLKKLTLSSCRIPWEDMSIVGSLPRLAVLKLQSNAAKGRKWNPNAGEFCQLKFLMIDSCELDIWKADDTHFPRLEHLHLRHLKLKEMPMDFAQISTLQMIELNYCSKSLFKSAKAMTKEREDLGYEDIQVRSFPSQTVSLVQDNVVGFEDEADTLIKYLNEECEELEVVSIIGMPGLGKTTLAWKIYHDVRIQHEFPTLIWVHVSQYLNGIREVFLTILKEVNKPQYRYLTEPELAEIVRSYLEERKFLLFLDDVWNAEAWSLIEAALPRSNRWGKVLITTQDEEVGARLTNRNIEPHKLRFLNLYESWELLQLKVFGKLDECPSDLKLLGKHIAKQCGGVPLAVVVIAGILFEKLSTSSTDIKDEWEKVLTSLNACLENDEQKLTENIISLSYNKLPHDLRDCFLYLGMFPEQAEIPVWNLIRLWIAEGFVKQTSDNSLEEVAEDNLKNLINRNLVMVGKTKAKDHVRTCRVHHMISKFCKNQAAIANQNFFQEVKKTKEGNFDPPVTDIQKYHRLYIHSDVIDFLRTIPKAPGLHSFLCFSKEEVILSAEYAQSFPDAFNSLRVLDVNPIRFTKFPTEVTKLVHLRYIALSNDDFESLPEAFSKLWNLQTIKIDTMWRTFKIKAHIWKMVNLRHLKTKSAIILNGEGGACA